MTTLGRSPPGKTGLKPLTFGSFAGLDTSRSDANLENPRSLHLSRLQDMHIDWRGQMVRDPAFSLATKSERVRHLRFYGEGAYAWVYQDGSGKLGLKSDKGHELQNAYDHATVVTSTVFNRTAYFMANGYVPWAYGGSVFTPASSSLGSLKPAFGCAVARRLVVAGATSQPTRVDISRLDTTILYDDEPTTETSALRAGYIDVSNLLGTADKITGVSQFEQNRLAVFTSDRTLIYVLDADIDNWTVDDRANIMIGCVSHNSIARAGVDLVFCSRSGVNHIQRSPDNGILVYSRSLSDKVDTLYRKLVASVDDPAMINAVFDPDEGKYHAFFPATNGVFSQRLTLSMNPEEDQTRPAWSTGTIVNATCGDFLAGGLLFGGQGGVYRIGKIEDETGSPPSAEFLTPILWLGDPIDTKQTHSLTLQAHGVGTLQLEVYDEKGSLLWSKNTEIEGDDDGSFDDVPLFSSYEIPMQLRARGFRIRGVLAGRAGLVRISGIAITYRI